MFFPIHSMFPRYFSFFKAQRLHACDFDSIKLAFFGGNINIRNKGEKPPRTLKRTSWKIIPWGFTRQQVGNFFFSELLLCQYKRQYIYIYTYIANIIVFINCFRLSWSSRLERQGHCLLCKGESVAVCVCVCVCVCLCMIGGGALLS